ncbi:hypothetical protein L0665_03710 [Methanogenium marinum]|uniref:Uncharacterized protein n=1 Tax=Methanogenium marinum TaxID=348610 RepID=A0A9Q4KTI4_9EURY|nr:hypothetical protein [Methanogenium marinum]MDE4907717.1 hypothetical protein [Methanogenium marinum]
MKWYNYVGSGMALFVAFATVGSAIIVGGVSLRFVLSYENKLGVLWSNTPESLTSGT